MDKLQTILVGVDLTPGCRPALQCAIRIGAWNRAAVRAVHVIDTLVAGAIDEALSPFQANVRAELIDDAARAWKVFAADIDGAGDVRFEARIDNRIRGILQAGRDAAAGLLVVGAYGSRPTDVGFGTVATACVRQADRNVLLVRDAQVGPFRTVIACVDFSATSFLALAQAVRVATQESAALHVLHVFDGPWHAIHYRAPTREADPHFQRQYRERIAGRLEAFARGLGHELAYLHPTFTVLDWPGDRSGIVEYARTVNADLIVLGAGGHSGIRDLILGTTAEKVLRESVCSVLAVRVEPEI